MFDEYFESPTIDTTTKAPSLPPVADARIPHSLDGPSVSVSFRQDGPSPLVQQGLAVDNSFEVNPFAPTDDAPFENICSRIS